MRSDKRPANQLRETATILTSEAVLAGAEKLPEDERADLAETLLRRLNVSPVHLADPDQEIFFQYRNLILRQMNDPHRRSVLCPAGWTRA